MAGKKKEQKGKKERPLEKWTMKELREEALKLEGVQGVHGMNKDEILAALRKARGIAEAPTKKKMVNVREFKSKIAEFKKLKEQERQQGASNDRLNMLRRKISRLKKQTRT